MGGSDGNDQNGGYADESGADPQGWRKSAEGYARMMSGDAQFRVVLTM